MTPDAHPEIAELLGAYALDALAPDERARVEEYLATDEAARREVDELRETAALLAVSHVAVEPVPEALWSRIEAELEPRGGSTWTGPRAGSTWTGRSAADGAGDNVVSLDAARASRRARVRAVALAAAVALVAGIGLGAVLRGSSSSSSVEAAYQSARKHGTTLSVLDMATKRRTMADIAFDPNTGNGYVHNRAMAALPAGQVYQLWVVPKGSATPVSVGVLGRDPGKVATFQWSGAMAAMAVSVEHAPGATTPGTVVAQTPPV